MSLLHSGDQSINTPCRAGLGQVPAVVVAVQHAVLGLGIEPLIVAAPAPVVDGERSDVSARIVIAVAVQQRPVLDSVVDTARRMRVSARDPAAAPKLPAFDSTWERHGAA